MKYTLSPLLLLALAPAAARADYVLNDFETDKAPWSTGSLSTSNATSGTHSLRLALPASDMWYCSSTIIDVTQYTAEQRQAAFATATKLIIDFTVGTYTASWMNDHHVGFILQGTGAENDWVSLGSQKWNGLGVLTTAEIPLTPAQAAILASDPKAKLFLYADYGNGSSKGINLFVDTFRTDASGSFSLPLALKGAHIESATTIALLCDDDVDVDASAGATITLQPTSGGTAQPLTLVGNGDKPEIVLLGTTSALSAGTSYTLTVSGLKGKGNVSQKEQVQFTVTMGADVNLSVDSLASDHRISPYIYGLSFAPSPEYMRRAGFTVNRWGGNAVSAFNWKLNATNRAADWYFLNSGMTAPETYISDNAAGGALTQWTLPCLPWVAKDTTSYCFSVAKYGAQQAVNPYNSDAGNGKTTSGARILNDFTDALVPNKPSPAAGDNATTIYQDEFLRSMDEKLGGFTRKVPFIAMDNEVDIWDGTHAEAMHDKMSYDSIVSNFTSFASMTRQEIPDAQIFGPVSTGWYYYWNSAKGGERASHDGLGFLPWFLKQVKAFDDSFGKRTLDVLDLHFYPEACTTSNGDATIDAWRMRATRELWDPSYTAEGSIGKDSFWAAGEPDQYKPKLIPRMKGLISTYYPGTKLAFTEWTYGDGLSGALADADALGIFGKYGVYYSTIWSTPATNEPGYQTYCLYRNPDDSGRAFGSLYLPASSPNLDSVSIFASLDSKGDCLNVILINKNKGNSRRCTVQLPSVTLAGTPEAFRFDEFYTDRVVTLPSDAVSVSSGSMTVVLPPFAAIRVIIPIVPTDSDNDGMADVWENLYSTASGSSAALNPAKNDADADNDNDGYTNKEEFLAGTNPQDAGSHPQFFITTKSDGRLLLCAFAPYDRTVEIQKSPDAQTWETIKTFAGSDGWIEMPYDYPTAGEFYRAVIR